MVIGITVLKVNHGCEIEVYQALKKLNGIKEIYRILGSYSIFVIMQAKDQFFSDQLIEDIRNTSDVVDFWHILISNDAYEAEIASPDRAETLISS
jgi:hypothetical protein